jgi:hypothetical protein
MSQSDLTSHAVVCPVGGLSCQVSLSSNDLRRLISYHPLLRLSQLHGHGTTQPDVAPRPAFPPLHPFLAVRAPWNRTVR